MYSLYFKPKFPLVFPTLFVLFCHVILLSVKVQVHNFQFVFNQRILYYNLHEQHLNFKDGSTFNLIVVKVDIAMRL
jgi:hypothetical protein